MAHDASLTGVAYRRVREDLLACRLPPGQRLNIKEMAATMSVSLGAVREALSRLAAEGFVAIEPQRGFRAAPISAADLRDLTRTRITIESMCLSRAIEVGDVNWEARIVAAYHRVIRTPQRAQGDPQRLNDDHAGAHQELHLALVAACDSPWLLRLREMLQAQSERYRYLAIPLSRQVRDLNREHDEIVKAVLARETARANELLARHFEATSNSLLETHLVEVAPPMAADVTDRRRVAKVQKA